MPFDSKSGAAAGRKGGSSSAAKMWKDKDPDTKRTKSLLLKISPDELAQIAEKAAQNGISRVELIVRAVTAYQAEQ